MDHYLSCPRELKNELGEYITSGVLAAFFFVLGMLAFSGGGQNARNQDDSRYRG